MKKSLRALSSAVILASSFVSTGLHRSRHSGVVYTSVTEAAREITILSVTPNSPNESRDAFHVPRNDRLLGLAQRAKTPARSPRRGGDTDCDEKAASYRGDLQASRDKMCLFEKEEQNTFHQGGPLCQALKTHQ